MGLRHLSAARRLPSEPYLSTDATGCLVEGHLDNLDDARRITNMIEDTILFAVWDVDQISSNQGYFSPDIWTEKHLETFLKRLAPEFIWLSLH